MIERNVTGFMCVHQFVREGGHWRLNHPTFKLTFRHRAIVQWLVPIYANAPSVEAAHMEALEKLKGEIEIRLPPKE